MVPKASVFETSLLAEAVAKPASSDTSKIKNKSPNFHKLRLFYVHKIL